MPFPNPMNNRLVRLVAKGLLAGAVVTVVSRLIGLEIKAKATVTVTRRDGFATAFSPFGDLKG